MTIMEKIEKTKAEKARAKPRSRRAIKLEMRLHDLVMKQLRLENRARKARAARDSNE
jgi:hypothetical protein